MNPIQHPEVPNLKPYRGRVRLPNGTLFGDYVDWFTDDEDACAGCRAILENQGYSVVSVAIENGTVIASIR